jgi:hypothetical protein
VLVLGVLGLRLLAAVQGSPSHQSYPPPEDKTDYNLYRSEPGASQDRYTMMRNDAGVDMPVRPIPPGLVQPVLGDDRCAGHVLEMLAWRALDADEAGTLMSRTIWRQRLATGQGSFGRTGLGSAGLGASPRWRSWRRGNAGLERRSGLLERSPGLAGGLSPGPAGERAREPSRGGKERRGEVPGWAGQAEEDAGPPGRGGLPGRGKGARPSWGLLPRPRRGREDAGPLGMK